MRAGENGHESLALAMRQKLDSSSGVPPDLDTRRRPDVDSLVAPRGRRHSYRAISVHPGALELAGPGIIDDFPHAIPISRRELEVIETYLGDLLVEALGGSE